MAVKKNYNAIQHVDCPAIDTCKLAIDTCLANGNWFDVLRYLPMYKPLTLNIYIMTKMYESGDYERIIVDGVGKKKKSDYYY